MTRFKLHFHADCDGITSAYFVSRELDRLNLSYDLYPSLGATVELKGTHNISLDISEVATNSPFNLSLDHHATPVFPLFHANPRRVGFEWPVCFSSYLLFGTPDKAWVAAIGVMADWCVEKVPHSFWSYVMDTWPDIVPAIDQQELINSPLHQMALMVDAAVSVNKQRGAIYALQALKETESPQAFLKGEGKAGKLMDFRERVKTEVEKIFGDEIVNEHYILLRFHSQFNVKSLVAGMAKDRYPNKLIVIAQNERDKVRFSLRGATGLDRLAKELTEGIGGGGGHPEASGGWVHHWKWDEFQKRLNQLVVK